MPEVEKPDATRRALFTGAVLASIAAPAAAATAADDARFLAWEAQAGHWLGLLEACHVSDAQAGVLSDCYTRCEDLIFQTPAAGATGARVKASLLLTYFKDYDDMERPRAALRSIVATLRQTGAA